MPGMFSTSSVRDSRFCSMVGRSSVVPKTGAENFLSATLKPECGCWTWFMVPSAGKRGNAQKLVDAVSGTTL